MDLSMKVGEGCQCHSWFAECSTVGIKYSGYWDEQYDENMNPLRKRWIHEFHINGRIIYCCPWCGTNLPPFTDNPDATIATETSSQGGHNSGEERRGYHCGHQDKGE